MCFFNINEFIKKLTVKQIELARETPIIPINLDSTILLIILIATAKKPVIIGPLVSLKE